MVILTETERKIADESRTNVRIKSVAKQLPASIATKCCHDYSERSDKTGGELSDRPVTADVSQHALQPQCVPHAL